MKGKILIGILFSVVSMQFALGQTNDTVCDAIFGEGQNRGFIEDDELNEVSGLIASYNNPGLLWAHNDSGDPARIFLMDDSARSKAVFYLEGVTAHDWEDIACIKRNNESYLLIGDIGDNKAKLANIKVHLVKEPRLKGKLTDANIIPLTDIITYILKYEDGPRDAETLFYDPICQKLYIISKRDLQVGLYETELPAQNKDTLLLKKRCSLPVSFVTSGDISADGTEVLIKNLLEVYYWKRDLNESIPDVLERKGAKVPYIAEAQGEAIAFAYDGSGYYTLSEEPFGLRAALIYYPKRRIINKE